MKITKKCVPRACRVLARMQKGTKELLCCFGSAVDRGLLMGIIGLIKDAMRGLWFARL
jgi:hypothetical protein